ncbi:MAG TPA: TAXI family TRAP transporter solute-binding subunit [Vicinamibacterales bacterium]|nr:TAXI family TRAP transporter solute-binding subunit [Vicinamibacterales bacterium]
MSHAALYRFGIVGLLTLGLAAARTTVRTDRREAAPPVTLRIVLDSNFGDAVARQFERSIPNARVSRLQLVGSGATVSAIEDGTADIGFVLADVAYLAYEHAAAARAHRESRIRAIAALEPVAMHVLVRDGVRATGVQDLVGLRVGAGTALSSQPLLANLLFRAYGLGLGVIQPDRRSDLLRGVDATIAVGYYPLATVDETIRHGAYLIPIDGPAAVRLRHEYPFVRPVTIPAQTYPLQHDDVATLGVQRLLVTSSAVDEAVAHDLTRVFIESLAQLSMSLSTSIRLTNLELASASPIPLHDGAARYYRERELMQ